MGGTNMNALHNTLLKHLEQLQITVRATGNRRINKNWKSSKQIPPDNRFYFFLEGEGWIKIRNEEFHPKPNQLLILPAGVQHSYATKPNNPFVKYYCHIDTKIGNNQIFHILNVPYCTNINPDDSPYVQRLFHNIH